MNIANKQKFSDHILEILCQWKTDESREDYKRGASISHILDLMRHKGWRNIGNIYDFERIVKDLGFKIIRARTKTGFHKHNRVITL